MSKPKLRVALLGDGFMGRAHSNAYCQAPHFFDLPYEIDRRILCGLGGETLTQTAAAWGWQETSTDWTSVVARPDIDLIDVALPNALHAPVVMAAAAAGKIVLCEKPLATSLDQAAHMRDAARGVPNMVWFNYRRAPAVAFARQMIAEGKLGRIFQYRGTFLQEWGMGGPGPGIWKTQKAHSGTGALGDLGSHMVDLALWLNGPIDSVTGLMQTFSAGRDVDDAALFLARFANGSAGTLEASRYATGYRNHNAFEIHGERGMLRFDLEDINHLDYVDTSDSRDVRGPRRLMVTDACHPYAGNYWKPGHVIGYEHTFIAVLADFLTGLAHSERVCPDFGDAWHVHAVLDAVERSASSGVWCGVAREGGGTV